MQVNTRYLNQPTWYTNQRYILKICYEYGCFDDRSLLHSCLRNQYMGGGGSECVCVCGHAMQELKIEYLFYKVTLFLFCDPSVYK